MTRTFWLRVIYEVLRWTAIVAVLLLMALAVIAVFYLASMIAAYA